MLKPIPLPVVVPDEFATLGTAARPLRPSKAAKFLACPMSVILGDDSEGGSAAQTGNLIHDAVEAFHNTSEEDRVAAGLKALEAAREQFPKGDPVKAGEVFRAYAADPQNIHAVVPWCEKQVRLDIEHPDGPDAEPIVIVGTLDQVRREPDGALTVWDLKTGTRLTPEETLTEHVYQQAIYVMAARQTLDPAIQPGGLIYTPGYSGNSRSRRFLPLKLSIPHCMILMSTLAHRVAAARKGVAEFIPSNDSCRFCPHKPWPKCVSVAKALSLV